MEFKTHFTKLSGICAHKMVILYVKLTGVVTQHRQWIWKPWIFVWEETRRNFAILICIISLAAVWFLHSWTLLLAETRTHVLHFPLGCLNFMPAASIMGRQLTWQAAVIKTHTKKARMRRLVWLQNNCTYFSCRSTAQIHQEKQRGKCRIVEVLIREGDFSFFAQSCTTAHWEKVSLHPR